jgi:16S rRNA processing protein RimM
VESARPFTGGLLIALQGIDSREQAAALTHGRVRVARSTLAPPAPGEFYVADLLGCEVMAEDGARLGVVRETFWNGAHDVMVIDGSAGPDGAAAEHLIPLVPEFVRAVDVVARAVEVAWQPQPDQDREDGG